MCEGLSGWLELLGFCHQLNHSHVAVVCGLDYALLLQCLEVAVYLVIRAVDDADEFCYMCRSSLGKSEEYFLPTRRSDDLLQLQLYDSLNILTSARSYKENEKDGKGES